MTVNVTSPITGSAQTGFTAPTYTVVQDTSPNSNSKQYAVTALGGTQTGVDVNSVSKPFTHTFFRPAVLKMLKAPNPVTGVVKDVPRNIWKFLTRKGGVPAVNQSSDLIKITTTFEIPAGVDTYEPEEIRAALSAHIGALNQQSAGIGDSLVQGTL